MHDVRRRRDVVSAALRVGSIRPLYAQTVAPYRTTAHAHSLRRRHLTLIDVYEKRPSEGTPGCGVRVERRAAGVMGRKSFVSIHTRPTVARDPSPEVYRAVREASQVLVLTVRIRIWYASLTTT